LTISYDEIINNSDSSSDLSNDQHDRNSCTSTVHESICVQAEVTVIPDVKIGNIKVFCKDGTLMKVCKKKLKPKKACVFEVNQKLCVEIPLSFLAIAKAEPKGIACGTPKPGKCPKKPDCKPKFDFLKSIFKSTLFDMILRAALKV
jgi:hypothetical protein